MHRAFSDLLASRNSAVVSSWLSHRDGPASQGNASGGPNAGPVFTAPGAAGTNTLSANAVRPGPVVPRGLLPLHELALEKVFREGNPEMVGQTLEFLANRRRLGDPALRDFIVSSAAQSIHPEARAGFQQVLSSLNLTASALLMDTIRQGQLALAEGVVKLAPEAATQGQLRWAALNAHGLGRTIAALRPDLERTLPDSQFTSLHLEPNTPFRAFGKTGQNAEQLKAHLDLMERFPHRADAICCHFEGLDDGSLTARALELAPLPHSADFWACALRWFPKVVARSLDARPEAVDRGLIDAAVRLRKHDVLKQACQLRPEVLNEKDRRGDTVAHLAASLADFNALRILQHHGADIQARNLMGASPGNEARLATRADLFRFMP